MMQMFMVIVVSLIINQTQHQAFQVLVDQLPCHAQGLWMLAIHSLPITIHTLKSAQQSVLSVVLLIKFCGIIEQVVATMFMLPMKLDRSLQVKLLRIPLQDCLVAHTASMLVQ